VVALTFVVGISVFMSNRRIKGRSLALSVSLAFFGSAFWALFVQLFRDADSVTSASVYHQVFAVVALLIPIGFLSYAIGVYGNRIASAIVRTVSVLAAVAVGYFMVFDSASFYTDIIMIEGGGNYALLANSPLVSAYSGIFGLYLSASVALVFVKALKSKKDRLLRYGLSFFGVSLMISSIICLVFNIILPMLGTYNLFWIGPLSIAITMLSTYFATLKYRLFINKSRLLQSATYLVVVIVVALIYICLFYLIFMLLFRGANPSDEIVIINFIMVIIVILLLPSINHLILYVKKIIAENGELPEGKNEAK
jgi:hypothetical protein